MHKRRITAEAIVAYSQCPRKAFFLLCTDEQGTPHEYLRILEQQQERNRMNYIRVLQQSPPEVPSLIVSDLAHEGDLVLKATLRTEDLEAYCDVLTRVESGSSLGASRYEPVICVGTHSIDKEQKLELHFAGYVLGKIQGKFPEYGLKKRHLQKFIKRVSAFYIRTITGKHYTSELVIKYQKRFICYRDSLFTFLQHDGIPWHNNTAERALRHIAKQQQISMNFHEAATHEYLRLLGMKQTCRFQNKSFFRFLLSREQNIDQFEEGKTTRRVMPLPSFNSLEQEDNSYDG